MVLVLDVGNTNIKFGLFNGDNLEHSWRMHSDVLKTADDYGINVWTKMRTTVMTPWTWKRT